MTEVGPRRVDDVDWEHWQPVDRATLAFVVQDGRVLLIRKKRGLGAGKITAPGGRIEGGETPLACAVRETQEETHVTPLAPEACGELRFAFADGYSIHVHVFRSPRAQGEPRETAEALPFWVPIADIPYTEMWADDVLWLPHLLERRTFSGRFVFEQDAMLDAALEVDGRPA